MVGAFAFVRVKKTEKAAATSEAAPVRSAGARAAGVAAAGQAEKEEEADPGPVELGTPKSSLRARPAWGKVDSITPHADATIEYAPQLSAPLEVFLAAAALRGDVERGLLICRVQSFNKMDTFAGDDLHARATFGDTPEVANDGPEDGNLAFVSAPLATLKRGDTARFVVFDRDVFEMELITRASAKYGGGPLAMTDAGAAIECRVLEGASLDKQTARYAEAADDANKKLSRHSLDGHAPEWGWPRLEIIGAQRRVADVAGLVGWDDPRTKKRIDGNAAAVAAVEAQRARVFDDLHASAGPEADLHGLHAKVEEIVCGAPRSPCAARVTLRNDASAPIPLGHYGGASPYLAMPGTGPVDGRFEGIDKGEIAPKETLEVRISADGAPLDAGPALVGICMSNRCAVLRAR